MRITLFIVALIMLSAPVLASTVERSELWYPTSTTNPASIPASIALATTQDGTENSVQETGLASGNLYTFLQATTTQPQTVRVTPSDTITFTSYFTFGANINSAYVTVRLLVNNVVVCQSGNDGTLGALVTSGVVTTQTCSPGTNTTIPTGADIEYRVTLWAADVSGGNPNLRSAQLRWDTATANTSITIESTSPLSISVQADQTEYAQGEIVSVDGVFNEFGGIGVNSDVTVSFINPSSGVEQERNVTSAGTYSETFSLPVNAETGVWTVQVRGWYDATTTIVNTTTFEVFDPPPLVEETTVIPNLAPEGSVVTVQANVTDNLGVDSVYAQLFFPNGTLWQNMTMTGTNPYSVNFIAPSTPTGDYSVRVWANDTAGSTTQGSLEQFTPYLVRGDWADITVDGAVSDWSAIAGVTQQANAAAPPDFRLTAGYLANNNTHLFGRFDVDGAIDLAHLDNAYVLYISTTTGGSSITPQGASLPFAYDYRVVIDATCVVYDAASNPVGSCERAAQTSNLELGISFATLGIGIDDTVNVTFETADSTQRLDILPVMSSFVSYTITQEPLDLLINITTNKPEYEGGESVIATGTVSWNNGTTLSGQSVEVRFRNPSNTIMQQQIVNTNSTGGFTAQYTLTPTPALGVWSATAYAQFNATFDAQALTTFEVIEILGPQIRNFSLVRNQTAANITWDTVDAGNTSFSYGINALDNQVSDPTPKLSHSIAITGLAPGTEYQYVTQSCNVDGCSTRTGTFVTLPVDGYCTYRYAVTGVQHIPGQLRRGDIVVLECVLPAGLLENQEVVTSVVFQENSARARFITPRLLSGEREVVFS